jgi:hypothetical protein
MSRTRYIGLPLLKENDTGNYSAINETLTRLDVLSTLALEQVGRTDEPTGLGIADAGKVWAVNVADNPTGVFWETVQEDSLLVWGYSADATFTVNPFSQQAAEGELRWYAIPVWDGAYAYDKIDGVFKTYAGGAWSRPTKRKITNFTLDRQAIEKYAEAGAWYNALTVSSPHKLVEVHFFMNYDYDAMSISSNDMTPSESYGMEYEATDATSIETQESEAGTPFKQPEPPFVLPKIALTNRRLHAGATAPTGSEIVCEGRIASEQAASTNLGAWIVPGSNFFNSTDSEDDIVINTYGSGNGPDGYSLGAAGRGLITQFAGSSGQEDLPSFDLTGAEGKGYLSINLSDFNPGSLGNAGYIAEPWLTLHSITFQITYVGG